jgi:hypothetical protein
MGARVIFNLKQSDGLYISLYSHWGETTCLEDTARAIEKARPRWDDETYCARILISQLVGDEWDSELGFGLWVGNEPSTDEEWVLIDLEKKEVTARDGTHGFEEFVKYHGLINA